MKNESHPDIRLLQKRLTQVVSLEEYEIAATIKRWIDELTIYYKDKKKTILSYGKLTRYLPNNVRSIWS